MLYPGDVGEGCGYDGEVCEPSRIWAVRWEEAAIAAAEGSKVEPSVNSRLSCTVGDGFFGAEPRKSFFVENFRAKLLPLSCSGSGNGCELFFAMRATGSMSSLNLRFSS